MLFQLSKVVWLQVKSVRIIRMLCIDNTARRSLLRFRMSKQQDGWAFRRVSQLLVQFRCWCECWVRIVRIFWPLPHQFNRSHLNSSPASPLSRKPGVNHWNSVFMAAQSEWQHGLCEQAHLVSLHPSSRKSGLVRHFPHAAQSSLSHHLFRCLTLEYGGGLVAREAHLDDCKVARSTGNSLSAPFMLASRFFIKPNVTCQLSPAERTKLHKPNTKRIPQNTQNHVSSPLW